MRVTIVGLLKMGHSAAEIHMLLKQIKVNERHVYDIKKTLKRPSTFTSIHEPVDLVPLAQKIW